MTVAVASLSVLTKMLKMVIMISRPIGGHFCEAQDPNLMRSHLKSTNFEDPQQRYEAHRRRDIK